MRMMNGDAKEEVRSKLDIEAVVGEYVQLRRAGRNWKGLSPFSDEKTPSFFVSPDKGIWHDFSSNQGGDVFSFVMLVEGLDFRGALEHLARNKKVVHREISPQRKNACSRCMRVRQRITSVASMLIQKRLSTLKNAVLTAR